MRAVNDVANHRVGKGADELCHQNDNGANSQIRAQNAGVKLRLVGINVADKKLDTENSDTVNQCLAKWQGLIGTLSHCFSPPHFI